MSKFVARKLSKMSIIDLNTVACFKLKSSRINRTTAKIYIEQKSWNLEEYKNEKPNRHLVMSLMIRDETLNGITGRRRKCTMYNFGEFLFELTNAYVRVGRCHCNFKKKPSCSFPIELTNLS